MAAGLSKRFGRDKSQIEFRGEAILCCSLQRLVNTCADEIVVVCHAGNRKTLEEESTPPRVRIVVNAKTSSGMAGSIQCGLEKCHKHSQGVLIVHADMPLVSTELMNSMIGEFIRHKGKIIAPRFQGQQGNPVLIPRVFWNEIYELRGDVGCKSILGNRADQIHWLDVKSDEILFDIDTEDDYREFIRRT